MIHATANVYKSNIGRNTKVAAFAEIGGAVVGSDCKIQCGAFIPPGVRIGNGVFVGPHVVFCNDRFPTAGNDWNCEPAVVGNRASIGAGAIVGPGVTIGADAIVGAGALVLQDVPPQHVFTGRPESYELRPRPIRLPAGCEDMAGLHITGGRGFVGEGEKQIAAIAEILDGRPTPQTVLDLGCGLGRAAVCVHRVLQNDQARYLLADFDQIDPGLQFGWLPDEKYNCFHKTNEFCRANGLPNFELLNLADPRWDLYRGIDLVVSCYAVGFHWPIETYLKPLAGIVADDAVLIFQVGTAGSHSSNRKQNVEIGGQVVGEFLVMSGREIKAV